MTKKNKNFPKNLFEPILSVKIQLPETWRLLREGGLMLHPSVKRVVVHGSRGPAGGFRKDSDLDLSLIVDPPAYNSSRKDYAELLQEVIDIGLSSWWRFCILPTSLPTRLWLMQM